VSLKLSVCGFDFSRVAASPNNEQLQVNLTYAHCKGKLIVIYLIYNCFYRTHLLSIHLHTFKVLLMDMGPFGEDSCQLFAS
jgi:hypothetical protein